MRVTPDLVLTGFFWLPANETVQLPGTVTVSDGGEIRLELLGTFEAGGRGWIPARTLPRVVGRVETHDYVTLERCSAQGEWSLHLGGISKSRFRARHLFLGVGYLIVVIANDRRMSDDNLLQPGFLGIMAKTNEVRELSLVSGWSASTHRASFAFPLCAATGKPRSRFWPTRFFSGLLSSLDDAAPLGNLSFCFSASYGR